MTSTSPTTFPYGDVTAVPAAGKAASTGLDASAAGADVSTDDAADRTTADTVRRAA
jgi:hypothetical protein